MAERCIGCVFSRIIKEGPYDDGNGISIHFGPPIIVRGCSKILPDQVTTSNLEVTCVTGQFTPTNNEAIKMV